MLALECDHEHEVHEVDGVPLMRSLGIIIDSIKLIISGLLTIGAFIVQIAMCFRKDDASWVILGVAAIIYYVFLNLAIASLRRIISEAAGWEQ